MKRTQRQTQSVFIIFLSVIAVAACLLGLGILVHEPSSAFATDTGGVLIVAPHPDDDLLYGAGVEATAKSAGHAARVVYLTNGDLAGIQIGLERQSEAVNGQSIIGVSEDNLIFLGYPDGYLISLAEDYPDVTDVFTTPNNGQSTTYGTRGLGGTDYHSYRFGSPGEYNRANVLLDLVEILLTYRPTDIYTTSQYDSHPDHSTTFSLVNAAVVQVHATDPTYSPMIHKTIVWWNGGAEWPDAMDPQADQAEIPGLSSTGLSWEERESLVVPTAMQSPDLAANPKYRAIEAHASQGGASGFLGRFVRRDEIFWVDGGAPVNHAPTANAGPDQTVLTNALVTLDGSASSDSDGNPLTYQWTQTGGPTVTLSSTTVAKPTCTAPVSATSLTFSLVVSDGQLSSLADTVTITVQAPATLVNIASLATVTASSQDTSTGQLAIKAVDGVISGYPADYTKEWATVGGKAGSWIRLTWSSAQLVSKIVLYDRPNTSDQITAATIRFSDGTTLSTGTLPDNGSALTLTFAARTVTYIELYVDTVKSTTWNIGLSEIEVWAGAAPNHAPTANAGPDQTVLTNALVTLDGSASSDSDGNPLTYQWTQTGGPTVTLSSTTVAKPTFTAPVSATSLTFSLVVSDGQLSSLADTVTITVQAPVNHAPTANAGPDQTVLTNALVTLDGSASSDSDGNPLTYQWTQTGGPTVTLSSTTVAKPTFTAPVSATSLTFSLVVSDGQLSSLADTVTITVQAPVNHAPTANAGPDQTVLTNALVTLDGSASSDSDGNPLTYQWTQTGGPTVTLSSTTVAKPTFTAPVSATSLTFSLVVSDGQLSSLADTVTITVQAPATLVNIASLATVTASSQDTSTGQLAIKAVDGVISGYPADYTKEWATVGGKAGSWIRLTWSSAQLVSKIVLYDRPNTSDQITAATIRFSDGTTLSTGTLPDNGSALTLTFAARTVTYIELYVDTVKSTTWNIGLSEIEVWAGAAPNHAPTANAGPDQTVLTNALVTLDGSASSDSDGNPLTYQWTQTGGPTVTLSSTTVAKPTFTAPVSATSLTFSLVVSDGQLSSLADTVTITVQAPVNHAPTANAGPDQTVLTNALVTLDGSASSDSDGNPLTYQWTQTGGPTVTLSSTTVAKPTFTAPVSATSLTFSLVVSDGQLSSLADTVTITVQAPATLVNIASLATVTASSQDTSTGQLAIKAVDGVISGYPADYTKEWATVGGKAGSWIRLTWSSAQLVSKIVLYDRPNTSDQITAATIRFSDGTTLSTGTLPDNGSALTLTFAARTVTYIELYVDTVKSTTWNIGLSEIEVWAG